MKARPRAKPKAKRAATSPPSKEEIGSSNAELVSLNEEMTSRNAELVRLNGELKRAELAAEAARLTADELVDTVREPLVVLDAALRVERVNRSFYATFKVSPEETLGRYVYELGNGQWDVPALHLLLERILPERNSFDDFEVAHEFERIGRRTFLLNARRIRNTPDGGERILLAIDDITERRRMEGLQRESDARFALFMRFLPGPAWIKDAAGRYLFGNEAAERVFRVGPGGVVGRSDRELFPAERAAEFEESDRRVLAGESGLRTVSSLPEMDGRLHHSIVSKFAIPGAGGAPDRVGGIAIDITDLKEAEEAVRRSEARFRTLAEALPGIIWRLDADGRAVYVNPQYLEFFGKTTNEVLGDGWRPLLHPDDARDYLATVARAQREHTRLRAAVRAKDRHGEWRWLESSALPEFDAEGRYCGHVGVSLDVTDQLESAATLAEADQKKNEFLAMLGHELRNPLAPMRSWLAILRRVVTDETGVGPTAAGAAALEQSEVVSQAVEVVSRQLDQMVRLVDDLLDIGRITRGRIELRPERVELARVVDAAVESVGPLYERQGHELAVDLPPEPVWLDADFARLVQVIANLLHNAAKYTDPGGHVNLAGEVVRGRREHPVLVLRVRDDGDGIPSEELPKIFDMFHQIDPSRAGLGVGLTLVKTLVERHGGSIEARSEGVGRGAEFVVRLPVVEPEPRAAAGDARERAPEPAPAAETNPGSVCGSEPTSPYAPLCILVVDDNRDSADSIALLLRLEGHDTHTAYDGVAGLEAAERLRPDALVLDLGLPGLSGLEVAERVRSTRELERAVLIAVSGRGQEDDHERSRAAGFDLHLVKPVDPALLARRLRELCAARRRAPAS